MPALTSQDVTHSALASSTLPDIGALPDDALLTRAEVARLSGFANITLRIWAGQGRGPKITRVEGRPRFAVRDVRAWLAGTVDGRADNA